MYQKKNVGTIMLVLFISFSISIPVAFGKNIEGWLQHYDRINYDIGIDESVKYSGNASAFIASQKISDQIGTLTQWIKADKYVGKRLKFNAYIKTEIESTVKRAEIYMNIWGIRNLIVGGLTNFAHIEKNDWNANPIELKTKKISEWHQYSVTMEIPEDCRYIEFGMTMHCKGKFWIDNITFEEVGKDQQVSNKPRRDLLKINALDHPANLNFDDK